MEDIYAPAGEGDNCLMMPFALLSLSIIERLAERFGKGAERGLIEDALETGVGVARSLQSGRFSRLAQDGGEFCGAGERGGRPEAGKVACLGEQFSGENDPHSGQAADEGPFRVRLHDLSQLAVDDGDAIAASERFFGHFANERRGDSLCGT